MDQSNPFLESLARYQKVKNERGFLAVAMSGVLLSRVFGDDWVRRHLLLTENPDPWMLNGSQAWLNANPVPPPDIRRAINLGRIQQLADALFTIIGKVEGFELLRERFLKRSDTRAAFIDAQVASLLVYNGCGVKIIGESGTRGQDFDLLVTTHQETVSVEVTSIIGGPPSVRSLLNKLHNKRSSVSKQ